jgi:RNA polymerase sigma factor (sigma-70 family)
MPAGGRARPLGSKRLLALAADDRLVEQIRRGNERAFEAAYERYGSSLLSFCRHMLGSTEEAEDAVQHTFAAAYGDLLRDERDIKLKPWLYTIARNRCLTMLRARREQPSEPPEIPTAGLQDEVQRRADLRELLDDLRQLPEDQRAALLLAEVSDMPHAEIGEVLGCEASKVKALVFRARSGLIQRRDAREIPCGEIREQLATLRGGSLRRTELRHHLRSCPGCRQFREEVRRQRTMLAAVLPVTPSLGLKSSVLAAVGLGGGSAGGGAAGAAAGAAAVGPLGSATLAKVALVGVLAGGGVVAGDALVKQADPAPPSAGASAQGGAKAAGPAGPAGSHPSRPTAVAPGHAGSTPARSRRRAQGRRGHRGRGKDRAAVAKGHSHSPSVHAGPKPMPPQSHANPPGRPAPTRPPVRRRGAGVRRYPGAGGSPNATPRGQVPPTPPARKTPVKQKAK